MRTILPFIFMMLLFELKAAENEVFVVDDIKYALNESDGTAICQGPTSKKDFSKENLTIPATISNGNDNYTVISIANSAFQDCSNIAGVLTLPPTLKNIGEYAFNGCSISSVDMSSCSLITEIGRNSFYFCRQLETVDINGCISLEKIGAMAFSYATNLTGIDLGACKNLEVIGSEAFSSCRKLSYVGNLGECKNLQSIEDSAFFLCKMETLGDLENCFQLKTIGISAFRSCSMLTTIKLPFSLQEIGYQAFNNCTSLTSIYCYSFAVPQMLHASHTVDDFLMSSPMTTAGTLYVPEGCVEAYSEADGWKEAFKKESFEIQLPETGEVVFNDLVFTIDTKADIAVCKGLVQSGLSKTDLTIPDFVTFYSKKFPVTSIVDNAFKDEKGITGTLTLSENLITIGNSAFSGCSGLTGSLTVPQDVAGIGSRAFMECDGLDGNLILNESLITIGEEAFANCSALKGNILIPSSVTQIDAKAFYNCSGLDGTINLSNSLLTIGASAFENCFKLTGNLIIPNTVTELGEGAFKNCEGLNGNLTLSSILHVIPVECFYGCKKLKGALKLPYFLTTIGTKAFYECESLTGDLSFPSNVTEIGENAFSYCSGFTGSLTLPGDLKKISAGIFTNCSGLSGNLKFPEKLTHIGAEAFKNCESLTGEFVFPHNLEEIADEAFYSCSGIQTVDMKGCYGQVGIGSSAFYNCESLQKVLLPFNLVKIGAGTFVNCSELENIFCYTFTPAVFTGTEGDYLFSTPMTDSGHLYVPAQSIAAYREANGWKEAFQFDELDLEDNEIVIEIDDILYQIDRQHNTAKCMRLKDNTISKINLNIVDDVLFYGENYPVTEINSWAFYSNKNISGELTLGKNIELIGSSAFEDCNKLQGRLKLPDALKELKPAAFYMCSGFSGPLELPENINKVGGMCFYGCSGFTGELIFPSSVNDIGNHAFNTCSNLTSIDVSECDKLLTIGSSCFAHCSNVKVIKLPSSLKSIGYYAMAHTDNLMNIYCPAITPPPMETPNVGLNILFGEPMTTEGTLWVPAGSVNAYRKDKYWGTAKYINEQRDPVGSIEIASLSMEGKVDKQDLKPTERLYLTVLPTPTDAAISKINWTASPDGLIDIDVTDEIGLNATIKVLEDASSESVVITAQVDDTEVNASYTVNINADGLILGDANDNGSVTLADVITIANEILAQNSGQPSINKNFCFINADVDKNLRVDIIDQNATTNIAMGLPPFPETASALAAAATTADILTADSFTAGDCAIGMRLDNAGSYVSLQADILLPRGMEVTGVTPGEGVTDHVVGYSISPDNRLRVLVYSLQNSSFAGNGQALFTVHGTAPAGCGSLAFGDIIAVDMSTRGHRLEGRGGSGDGTTAIGSIAGDDDSDQPADVYDLSGRLVRTQATPAELRALKPGLYIIRRGTEARKILVK